MNIMNVNTENFIFKYDCLEKKLINCDKLTLDIGSTILDNITNIYFNENDEKILRFYVRTKEYKSKKSSIVDYNINKFDFELINISDEQQNLLIKFNTITNNPDLVNTQTCFFTKKEKHIPENVLDSFLNEKYQTSEMFDAIELTNVNQFKQECIDQIKKHFKVNHTEKNKYISFVRSVFLNSVLLTKQYKKLNNTTFDLLSIFKPFDNINNINDKLFKLSKGTKFNKYWKWVSNNWNEIEPVLKENIWARKLFLKFLFQNNELKRISKFKKYQFIKDTTPDFEFNFINIKKNKYNNAFEILGNKKSIKKIKTSDAFDLQTNKECNFSLYPKYDYTIFKEHFPNFKQIFKSDKRSLKQNLHSIHNFFRIIKEENECNNIIEIIDEINLNIKTISKIFDLFYKNNFDINKLNNYFASKTKQQSQLCYLILNDLIQIGKIISKEYESNNIIFPANHFKNKFFTAYNCLLIKNI